MTLVAGQLCEDGVTLITDSLVVFMDGAGGRVVKQPKLHARPEAHALFATTGGWPDVEIPWPISDEFEWSAAEIYIDL